MRDCCNWKGPSRAVIDSNPILFHGFLVFFINGQSEWSLVTGLVSGRDGTRMLTLSELCKIHVVLLSNGRKRRDLEKGGEK